MIATKLIIQSVLGLGAIAGVVGGGYMMMGSSEEYLLVSASTNNTITGSTTAEETQVTKAPETTSKLTNNYKCQFVGTKTPLENKDCDIYSIDLHADNKSTNLKKLAKIDEKKLIKTKEGVVDKKFFLLKAKSDFYSQWKFDGITNHTINLMSTDTTPTQHSTLTVHGKVVDSVFIGATDLIVVKANKAETLTVTDASKTYKCKFTKEETTTDCSIYAFTPDSATNTKEIADLNWSNLTIPTAPANTTITITDKSYYVIKWNNQKIKDSQDKTVIFVESDTTQATGTTNKTASFKIESSLIGTFESSKQEVIILN